MFGQENSYWDSVVIPREFLTAYWNWRMSELINNSNNKENSNDNK